MSQKLPINQKLIIVTGSNGLVGRSVTEKFLSLGYEVVGIDNNTRADLFGDSASTHKSRDILKKNQNYHHENKDIRDRALMEELIARYHPQTLVHCAAQPSHDWAAKDPHADFGINALGTLNLLEGVRKYSPETTFVQLSTNKVMGDHPNGFHLLELPTRYDFANMKDGMGENVGVDQCKHSLFGVSKLAADLLVQEYGRYFNLKTVCLRAGCLTGAHHAGVELHGFLNYLVKCLKEGKTYKIFGYKGKQVRDNLDSEDLAELIYQISLDCDCGEVFNVGGGKANSVSILEAISMLKEITGKGLVTEYVDQPRSGDHIVYYTDLTKIQSRYPGWKITKDIRTILTEIWNKA